MKTKLIIVFLALLLITSCSQNNNGSDSQDLSDLIPTTYMPLTIGNYWDYNVQQVNPGAVNTSIGTDHLFISNDTLISGVTYKKMKTSVMPNGFFSNTLRNNGVKISGSSLIATGKFSIPFPGLIEPIERKMILLNINISDVNDIIGDTHSVINTTSDYFYFYN